jgi:hypothetical protein
MSRANDRTAKLFWMHNKMKFASFWCFGASFWCFWCCFLYDIMFYFPLCFFIIIFNVIFYKFAANYFVRALQRLDVVRPKCCLILVLTVSTDWDNMGCAVAYIQLPTQLPSFCWRCDEVCDCLFKFHITEQDFLKFHIPWHSFVFLNCGKCETSVKKGLTKICFQNWQLCKQLNCNIF